MFQVGQPHAINLARYKTEIDNPIAIDHPTTQSAATAYNTLEKRLASFANWKNNAIRPVELAEAGFYYYNLDDVVRCHICGIEGHNWVAGDRPMADHRSWNPDCPFVQENEHDHVNTNVLNPDTCGKYGIEILPNSGPEEEGAGIKQLEKLGVHKFKGPAHPDYITYDSRFKTFEPWPKNLRIRPEDLAAAGFYYLGVGDHVLCFHCGGGLKDWEVNDDPWEQHALWFDKCPYLILKKGLDYVADVKRKSNETVATDVPEERPSTSKTNPTASTSSGSGSQGETKEASSAAVNKLKLKSTTAEKNDDDDDDNEQEDKTLCKICYKKELGIVFLPCGHIVACVDCATALKKCAVCRKPLEATVRAFLS